MLNSGVAFSITWLYAHMWILAVCRSALLILASKDIVILTVYEVFQMEADGLNTQGKGDGGLCVGTKQGLTAF